MPLRDHFRPPLDNERSWDEVHGQWPAMIVLAVGRKLPRGFIAVPRLHLGSSVEIDIAGLRKDSAGLPTWGGGGNGGGVATAVWAPPRPTLSVVSDVADEDEYEVRVYDASRHRRLVAAVEIVSPANKDRPESRRVFVAKCVALLRQRVSVTIVDLVTTRQFNLYGDLVELIGQTDPSLAPKAPSLYAAACRWVPQEDGWHFQSWHYPLALGQPLPTMPLWLTDDLAVPLELESTYEETCRALLMD